MRQMVGPRPRRRPDRRRPAALGVSRAGPRGHGRGRALRAGADGDRRREDPDAVRRGAGRVRRRRRLRHRGRLGRLHGARARRALRPGEVPRAAHPVRRRAEAAGAGVPAARSRRGAAARRARQLPRRARQDLARAADPRVGQDDPVHQPRPRAARQHRDPGRHRRARLVRRRQPRVDPPRRLRVVPRGATRPVRALRGAAPPLGRGARQDQGAGAPAQDQGRVQRRHGLASTRPPRPGCASSRRPVRRPSSRASSRSRCGSRAAAPASARSSARRSS